MRSPRFSFREADLKKIFSASDLKFTWKKKVRTELRKSPLPDPIEHLDFHVAVDAECLKIERLVRDGSYQPSPAKRILMEKSKGLCRQISIPALRDLIVLQRLSDTLYDDIKGKAPSKRSFFEPEDHNFSNAKKENAGAPNYGSYRAWLKFQKMVLKFTEEKEFIIVTDVANYYDTISYTHLRNIISSQITIRETVLDTLIFVLSALLWQPDYMPRVEIGLPQINIDATRILAHCFLYELDEYLENEKYEFTRFMDDIDIGVDTINQARHILRDMDLILQTRQVRLNSGKTKILTADEARTHFCVRENYILDAVVKRIDRKTKSNTNFALEKKIVESLFPKYYTSGKFDAGAGEKILKRTLTIARKIGARIKHKHLLHILLHRPSCREAALAYLTSRRLSNKDAKIIASFIRSKRLVDDVSILSAIEALVEADLPRNAATDKLISLLIIYLHNKKSFVGVYALLWLSSKYKSSRELLKYLRLTFDIWRADALLGRLVGGMMPIARMDKRENELRTLLDNARNPDAYAVAAFHDGIVSNLKNVGPVRSIVVAANSSKPLGITHSKFLVMLSIVQNVQLTDKQKTDLLKHHSKLLGNNYYRHRLVRSMPEKIRSSFFASTPTGAPHAAPVPNPANQNTPNASTASNVIGSVPFQPPK